MSPPPSWPLRVMWEPGYDTTTKYKSTDTIFVHGDTSDTDEWDDDVLLHEFGHYLMKHYAQLQPTVTDTHWWYKAYPNDTCLAYKEGWATFFSGRARVGSGADSLYVDNWKINASSPNFWLNIENPWIGSYFDTTDFQGGPWCEGSVCGALWDIYDSYNEIPYHSYPDSLYGVWFPDTGLYDTLTMGFAPIWDVFDHYDPSGEPTNCWTIFHFRSGWNAFNYNHQFALNQILLHHRIMVDSAPSKPIGLTAQREFNYVRLYWRKNTESDLKGYRIYRRSKRMFVFPPLPWSSWTLLAEKTNPTDTTHLDTLAKVRYSYRYRVTAFDTLGNESPPSDSVQISLLTCQEVWSTPPGTPPEITAYNNSRRFVKDALGTLHLAFTSGDSVYHTFLQDTLWSEPVLVGQVGIQHCHWGRMVKSIVSGVITRVHHISLRNCG